MKSKSPLVSIIMPAFNCEKYIERSIISIINQTYQNWELLICDDSSTDKTYVIIEGLQDLDVRIKIWKNDYNKRQVITRNFLISKSVGQLIAFQDGDDWSHTDRIDKQVNEFNSIPDLGICGTWAQYYDEAGVKSLYVKSPSSNDEDIKQNILRKNQFCGASIMIRKEILAQVGYYREYFSGIGNEDYDLTSRIVERFKAMNIDLTLYCVRRTEKSSSRGILSPHQLISEELVKVFIRQRRVYGMDYIEGNNITALKGLEAELLKPYTSDPSLQYRKAADINWYNGNKRNYFKSAYLALTRNPYKPLNWKYFIHAITRMF